MDFELISNEFDITMEESDDILNQGLSELAYTFEYADDEDSFYEAGKGFASSVRSAFSKIIEAVRKFIQDLIVGFKSKYKQIGVQKKLAALEKELALNATNGQKKIKGKKGKYNSVKAYMKVYKSYVSDITKMVTALSTKKFKTAQDAQKEFDRLEAAINKKYSDFISSEGADQLQILSLSAEKAVKLSKNEFDTCQRNFSMIDAIGNTEIQKCQKLAIKDGDPKLVVFAKTAANKIASATKKAANTVSKHPFRCLAAVVAVVGGITVNNKVIKPVSKRANSYKNLGKEHGYSELYATKDSMKSTKLGKHKTTDRIYHHAYNKGFGVGLNNFRNINKGNYLALPMKS